MEDSVIPEEKGNIPEVCYLNSGDGRNLSATPIHSIPIELLDYIFTFLDIQERIQTERVCKRWRTLGVEQLWSEPKYFVFDHQRLDEFPSVGKLPLTDNILSVVLSRCGANLRSLTLSDRWNCQVPITGKTLGIIGKYCPNITEIELNFLSLAVPSNCLAKLCEDCRKLKVVSLFYIGKEELLLQSFLRQCEGLESLALFGEKLCPKDCDFEVINKNLKVLDLRFTHNLLPDSLDKLMERCDGIQELRLRSSGGFRYVSPEVLLKFVHHYCNTLKVLDLTCTMENFIINWCAALSKLYKLEELHITGWDGVPLSCHSSGNCFDVMSNNIKIFNASNFGNSFEEVFVMKLLSKNDNIQKLQFLYSGNLSTDFFKLCLKYTDSMKELVLRGVTCETNNWCECFLALRNLVTLDLMFCGDEVNDEVAQIIANNCRKVKNLDIGSTAITDIGLSYISSLPLLTELNLNFMPGITDKGIVVLANEGRIQRLNLGFSGWPMAPSNQITEESCCLLARLCPRFRVLNVKLMDNISNNLVTAFYESLQNGYLKQSVTLYVYRTSVTSDCKKHHRLVVVFTS